MNSKHTPEEVLKLAVEILQWRHPSLLTAARLKKVKIVAGAALSQTHSYLRETETWNERLGTVNKPRVTIQQIVEFNALKNKK